MQAVNFALNAKDSRIHTKLLAVAERVKQAQASHMSRHIPPFLPGAGEADQTKLTRSKNVYGQQQTCLDDCRHPLALPGCVSEHTAGLKHSVSFLSWLPSPTEPLM